MKIETEKDLKEDKTLGRRISTWIPSSDQWMWQAMDSVIKKRECATGVRLSHGSLIREILCAWCRDNAEEFVPDAYKLPPKE